MKYTEGEGPTINARRGWSSHLGFGDVDAFEGGDERCDDVPGVAPRLRTMMVATVDDGGWRWRYFPVI